MKIEIDDNSLIDEIVKKVVEEVKPLFTNLNQFRCDELMTVEEVRTYLKAKRSSIYEKVHTKSIPFLKYGKSLRFKKTHIDIWLLNPYHPDLSNYNLNYNGRG
jgi:excisionase family DNA binding protein